MKKELRPVVKFSLQKELSRSELKQVVGGTGSVQTYCSSTTNPFPICGAGGTPPNECSTSIGCNPNYCASTGHGTFLYCA